MRKLKIKYFRRRLCGLVLLITASFFATCKTDDLQKNVKTADELKFIERKTESRILEGYGIDGYKMYSPNHDTLRVTFDDNGEKNSFIYSTDAELSVQRYAFQGKNLKVSMMIDDRKGLFTLISSENDRIEFVMENHQWLEKATKTKIDPLWHDKLNFNSEQMVKMFEIIKEIQTKKQFVTSIEILNKKINDEIIIKKSMGFASQSSPPVPPPPGTPCSRASEYCAGDMMYHNSQAIACDSSLETLGSACSNRYCIGYCSFIGCDCVCLWFDYACHCTAKGRFCLPPVPPVLP